MLAAEPSTAMLTSNAHSHKGIFGPRLLRSGAPVGFVPAAGGAAWAFPTPTLESFILDAAAVGAAEFPLAGGARPRIAASIAAARGAARHGAASAEEEEVLELAMAMTAPMVFGAT